MTRSESSVIVERKICRGSWSSNDDGASEATISWCLAAFYSFYILFGESTIIIYIYIKFLFHNFILFREYNVTCENIWNIYFVVKKNFFFENLNIFFHKNIIFIYIFSFKNIYLSIFSEWERIFIFCIWKELFFLHVSGAKDQLKLFSHCEKVSLIFFHVLIME